MNFSQAKRIYIEFVDREYGDQWAALLDVQPWGISVKLETVDGHYWFYPWTSILAIRLDVSTERSA